MSDTQRALSDLAALFADQNRGGIDAPQLRDFLVSVLGGYGAVYVQDGATPQSAIGTLPVQLVGFAANGPSSGTTPDFNTNQITVGVAGDYLVECSLAFSGTASRTFQARLRKQGLEVAGVGARAKLNASGDITSVSFSGLVTCAANDILQVYVEADQAASSLTLVDANFAVKRVS